MEAGLRVVVCDNCFKNLLVQAGTFSQSVAMPPNRIAGRIPGNFDARIFVKSELPPASTRNFSSTAAPSAAAALNRFQKQRHHG
jgi:hypothetical protein